MTRSSSSSARKTSQGDTPILEEGRNCGGIHPANRMAVLVDGERYFNALADVLERAQRHVYFACWDIDSRIRLRRDPRGQGDPLRDVLEGVVEKNRELEIYFLSWDFAMIYLLEREHLPLFKLGWKTSQQIRFHMDDEHPVGASHHQKFVVVDDRLAFVGGIDLTRGRWDTSRHEPGDPRRVMPAGRHYMPFHDVQAVVDAQAVAALGSRFRERWYQATEERLQPRKAPAVKIWPPSVSPDFEEVMVAISETRPPYRGRPAKSEIRNLYLDAISSAKRYVYIENQYLTASEIVDTMARSLSRRQGPEIVMVLPLRSEGWLEEKTMNTLRRRHLLRLMEADSHGRLRVFYPEVEELDGWVNVHAKLLIADDRIASVGSANLSNRSMGLDTECDLAVEARDDEQQERIANLRDRLIGEHLGVPPASIGPKVRGKGSLIAAVTSLQGGPRTLRPLTAEATEEDGVVLAHSDLLDPEKPTTFDRFVDRFMLEEKTLPKIRAIIPVASLIGVLLLLALAWKISPLSKYVDAQTIIASVREAAGHEAAPLLAVGVFIGAGLLSFPITVLFVATAILFDLRVAVPVSLAGCLISASVTYAIGRRLGRAYVRRIAGDRVNGLSRWLSQKGIIKTALIRLLPTAPFSVVNVVACASHLGFRDYILGTALGMVPGILTISLLSELAFQMVNQPRALGVGVFFGVSALFGAVLIWMLKRSRLLNAPSAEGAERESREPSVKRSGERKGR